MVSLVPTSIPRPANITGPPPYGTKGSAVPFITNTETGRAGAQTGA